MPKERINGIYSIIPSNTSAGRRNYQITGWTELGARIRQRTNTEVEAKAAVDELVKADNVIKLARQQSSTAITERQFTFSSPLVTSKARLDDVEAALRLFPKTEAGFPDPRWSLEEAARRGLENGGYNPTRPDVTVAEVAPIYAKYYEWRHDLDEHNENYVSKATLNGFYPRINRLVKLFGSMKFSVLAGDGELKRRIENAGLKPSIADKLATTFNGMARWGTEANLDPQGERPAPAHPLYISSYKPWCCPYKIKGIPEVYSPEEWQALLDEAWNQTVNPKGSKSRAAVMIVRIWCAVRPSETDHPDFRVNEDCSLIYVPEGTKTGFRMVPVPPCAQIQLRLLKAKGLLSFEKVTYQTMAVFRGKAGFPLNSAAMRATFSRQFQRPYREVTAQEAENWFRSNWPLRFGRKKQDIARHTGGSAHANAGQDLHATAKYMGNHVEDLDHYLGLFRPNWLDAFYQAVATPLKSIITPGDIPMPFWFNTQHAEARHAEQLAVAELVSNGMEYMDEICPRDRENEPFTLQSSEGLPSIAA